MATPETLDYQASAPATPADTLDQLIYTVATSRKAPGIVLVLAGSDGTEDLGATIKSLLTTIDADTGAMATDLAALETLVTAGNVDLAAIEVLLTTLAAAVTSNVVQTDVLTRPAMSPKTDGATPAPVADTVRGVSVSITDDATDTLIAAQGAGQVINVTSLSLSNSHASVATWVEILSSATVIWEGYLLEGGGSREVVFPQPLRCAANEALGIRCETTGAAVRCTAIGFVTDES